MLPSELDQCRLPPASLPRQIDRASLKIRVHLVLRQPERQRQRRVTQRPRQGIAQARGRRVRPQLDEQLGDRGACEAGAQHRREQRKRNSRVGAEQGP